MSCRKNLAKSAGEEPLWVPSRHRVDGSNMQRFMQYVNNRFDREFTSYDELYHWSVDEISDFWASWWDFSKIIRSADYLNVIDDPRKMPGARWFSNARMNFAQNLMRYRDNHTALVFRNERSERIQMSYSELHTCVAAVARTLRELGIGSGDRVAGFMPNIIEAVVAMLAATSIGAIWTSCSPDFGINGVVDRFGQTQPKVLFAADGYHYNGKTFHSGDRIRELIRLVPSIQRVIMVRYPDVKSGGLNMPKTSDWDDVVSERGGSRFEFVQTQFDHPLLIMHSSGTTGVPKCMVQSAGGILINHLKELVLHTDLMRKDTIFYFTTCGWMMWNWLVSSLAIGAKVVLYDGSPFWPDKGSLIELIQDEGVTIFGTSAPYLSALEKEGIRPKVDHSLSSLKTILSTGSPLSIGSFDYVYRDIKSDVCLSSISGGAELNGCFALGNPMLPVYPGELQCRGLGMSVEVFGAEGQPVWGERGELACTKPFPSMPLYFWNDPSGEIYLNAYFKTFPGVWHHGDYAEVTKRGGLIIYGRSDATLKPGGVRIGTAEIYRQLEGFNEIDDSLVVGQQWENDTRIVLFVKLKPGSKLTDELRIRITKSIRENLSPRHVPSRIVQIADIPYTINMKKVELAVCNIINGRPVLNKDALKNPESLELYRNLDELRI